MHLISRYALSMGSLIDKPSIQTKFYPLRFEKYITFNAASTNMVAKNYALWQEVLNIISPELQKNGIQIIQLGDGGEMQYAGVLRLNGQTSIPQSAYVIKNALLHFGVDSMLSHIADSFDIPLVTLFSVSPPDTCGPFFGDKSKQILLEPNFKEGENYYYNPAGPNIVNSIKIEDIVESISKLIGISFPKIKTQHIGQNYLSSIFELVPNALMPREFNPPIIPTIRLDLGGEAQMTYQQLSIRKSAVYTKTALDINILMQVKPNIERIIYFIDGDPNIEFIKGLASAGIPFVMITDKPEEKIGLLKLDLADYGVLHQKPKSTRPNIKINGDTYFKSNKIVFSEGKAFLSVEHLKLNEVITDNSNVGRLIDTEAFWEEMGDFAFIYSKL